MSVEALALALHHSRAKGTDKLVLIGITNHDGDGGAWPSHDTLAKYANCSVTRVKQAIKTLVELGEVAVQVRAGGDTNTRNDRRPNLYQVTLSCPPTCDGSKKHRTTVTPSDCRQDENDRQNPMPRQAEMQVTTVTPSACEPSIYEPSMSEPSRASTSSTAGDDVAKRWWSEQSPKPAGKRAWWSLLNVCRGFAAVGWSEDAIYDALNRGGGSIPSMAYMERLLRNTAGRESNRERSIREAVERTKRLAEQEHLSALTAALGHTTKELGA